MTSQASQPIPPGSLMSSTKWVINTRPPQDTKQSRVHREIRWWSNDRARVLFVISPQIPGKRAWVSTRPLKPPSLTVGNPFCLALLWPICARRDKLCPQFRDRNWHDTNDVRLPCKYPHSKGIYLMISKHKKFSRNSNRKVVKNAKYYF